MNKRIVSVLAVGLATLALVGLCLRGSGMGTPPAAFAAAGAGATIADFMVVVHDPQGLLAQLQRAATGSGPANDKDWKILKARAAIIPALAESILTTQTPAKGTKSSWSTLVGGYLKSAKRVAEAAAAEKASAVQTGLTELKKTCAGCHKAHR